MMLVLILKQENLLVRYEILLRKNRNGPTGKVKLKFIERFAKFADMSTLDDNEVKKFQSKANNGFDSNKKDPF